jgi:pyrimidine operon attenuation protein/uracil phosphoribosyltransferase
MDVSRSDALRSSLCFFPPVPNTAAPPHTARQLLDEAALTVAISQIADRILARHEDVTALALIGIPSRGVELASRVAAVIAARSGKVPLSGAIDISMHRDDMEARHAVHAIQATRIPGSLSSAIVILVDDVLQSGRTCRAALDALSSFGRPKRVEYAVLIDRGLRELPIAADYTGHSVSTLPSERVFVRLRPLDSVEGVWIEGKHRL